MPFTVFAHQAPILPLKMRSPRRWDGLGLAVGSIMPDLWYVTKGWGYGPAGVPLWVDGHQFLAQPLACIVPGMVLTWLARRVVAPVVPSAMPKAGPFRLRDYRLLSLARHRWWVTGYSVTVGALSHLLLDAFTHRDGFVVANVAALQDPLVTIGSASFTAYRLLQFLGHVAGSAIAVRLLVVIGRRKLLWEWHGFDGRPPDQPVEAPGPLVVRAVVVVGTVCGLVYAAHRFDRGFGTAFIGWLLVTIGAGVVAGLVARRWFGPVAEPSASPAAVDPLLQ